MTDTDWKEEAGMGAEPPVPESPVIPPVAEGTEPGAGELPQQGVPAEPVQESPAGQLDGPEEASSDLLPDSGAPVGAAEPAGETNGPASAPSQPGESGEQVYEEPVADAPVGEQMEEPIPQDAFAEGATSEAPNGAVPEAAPGTPAEAGAQPSPQDGQGQPGTIHLEKDRDISSGAPIPDTMPVGREGAPSRNMARPRMRTPISTMDSIRTLTWVRPTASRRKVGRIKIRRRRMHRRIRSSKYTGTTSSSRASRRWAVRCLRSLPRGGSRGRTRRSRAAR